MEHPIYKWMMTGVTPIDGNPQDQGQESAVGTWLSCSAPLHLVTLQVTCPGNGSEEIGQNVLKLQEKLQGGAPQWWERWFIPPMEK